MLKRLITGLCFIGVIIGFFFLRNINRVFFEGLVFLFVVIGTGEMLFACRKKMSKVQTILAAMFALAVVPVYHFFAFSGIFYLLIAEILLLFLALVVFNDSLDGIAYAFITLFYPGLLLLSMLYLNNLSENSTLALLFVFTISPAADTLAYAVGITFKGKKLCPNISPNKTISGGIGGLLGGALGALVLYFIFKNNIVYSGGLPLLVLFLTVGIVAAFLTEAGDLVESVIKRRLEIKDMGKLLPGHGGILDRIDGVIFCSWFIAAVFMILI